MNKHILPYLTICLLLASTVVQAQEKPVVPPTAEAQIANRIKQIYQVGGSNKDTAVALLDQLIDSCQQANFGYGTARARSMK
ncbi:MAG: hypothetical protein AAGB22_12200, partial [Bacteroidota bacterium]